MFYVLCNDEGLWMTLCLAKWRGDFFFKGLLMLCSATQSWHDKC